MHSLDATQDYWQDKTTKYLKSATICWNIDPIFYNHLSSKLDIEEAGEVITWLI